MKTAGYLKTVTTEYNINGTNQKLNDGDGFYAVCDGITIPYSTNRYMLIRKKTVKDGLHAVASNASNFATLCEEWDGIPVGGSTSGSGANNPYCYSGRCFSDIAQYDYAKQYVIYRQKNYRQLIMEMVQKPLLLRIWKIVLVLHYK